MPFTRDGRNELADRLRGMAQDMVELIGAQLRMTRIELLGDARVLGARVLRLLVFGPLLFLGYTLVVVGLVVALAHLTGTVGALLLVGALHLAVGALGCHRAVRALKTVRVLDRSRDELERSMTVVSGAATGREAES